jgi:hypothetical protein
MANNFEPQPQDLALEAFRRLFFLNNPFVSEDGMTMTYKCRNSPRIEEYMVSARVIILMQDLPLRVERDRFAMGDLVFEDNIVIRFEPELIELSCY